VWVDLDETDVRTIRRLTGTDGPRRDGNPGGKPNPQGRNDRPGAQQGPGKRGRDRDRGGRGGNIGPYGQNNPNVNSGYPNVQQAAAPRDDEHDPDREEDFGPIPNPLEQTFDRRFVQKSRPFASGFGRGGSAPDRSPPRGNGPREPDPLQTSVGYIGADAFHRKGNRGGGGGNRGGGGGGGNRNGGGNRGGGGFGGGGGGGGRRGR